MADNDSITCLSFVGENERCWHSREDHDGTGECHALTLSGRFCPCIEFDPGDAVDE